MSSLRRNCVNIHFAATRVGSPTHSSTASWLKVLKNGKCVVVIQYQDPMTKQKEGIFGLCKQELNAFSIFTRFVRGYWREVADLSMFAICVTGKFGFSTPLSQDQEGIDDVW